MYLYIYIGFTRRACSAKRSVYTPPELSGTETPSGIKHLISSPVPVRISSPQHRTWLESPLAVVVVVVVVIVVVVVVGGWVFRRVFRRG